MKLYKFAELSEQAKQQAIADYRAGYAEAFEHHGVDLEIPSEQETFSILTIETTSALYDESGACVKE